MEASVGVRTDDRDMDSVYAEIHARLWKSLLAYSGDPDVADESLAEAFAQALRRGDAIRDAERWVWRAAFRIAAGELKRRRRRLPDVDARSYDAFQSEPSCS